VGLAEDLALQTQVGVSGGPVGREQAMEHNLRTHMGLELPGEEEEEEGPSLEAV